MLAMHEWICYKPGEGGETHSSTMRISLDNQNGGILPALYNTCRRARHGMATLAAAGLPAIRGSVKTTVTGESG